MTEQPRDSDGKFTLIDTEAVENRNDADTVGECSDTDVTPNVDYVNVDIEFLEEAIERAKMFEDTVRIGTISKQTQKEDRTKEEGMVLVKGSPKSDRVVPVVGLTREWSNDDE